MALAFHRIRREINEVIKSEEAQKSSINIEIVGDDYRELRGQIAGPPETPYEGGTYKLEIKVPETYPYTPPKIKFLTKIWHPNISSVTGVICLDILKDQWAAGMNLRTMLLSIQALLTAAEPDDPQDNVVAIQYKLHRMLFNETAKYWCSVHAGGSNKKNEFTVKLRGLMEMGVEELPALVALSGTNWDMQSSVGQLFP